ncbi:hypothetical protein CAPTEDRAFT_19398 [Capitella teleta]|uniref:FAM20 C-terminal domain-containing protein n=1 Tax=Capitella teleta TaxID=283909 RepID=R7VI66_CAPTE|nr:hypothetical protein CAPTEDRAFT_19398 [Capitella teleta]|eukprot:ELU15405.1 hypothetical protein CAPTEDRAFT_19398 [Capitella teleta]
MKFKARLIFFTLLLLVLFISFKILEPEIQEHKAEREVIPGQDYVLGEDDADEFNPAEVVTKKNVTLNRKEAKRSAIVQRFIEMYALDWNYTYPDGKDALKEAATWVQPRSLHPEYDPGIGAALHDLASRRILKADVGFKGTQLKLTLELEGGQRVIFKPQWFERDHIITGRPYDGADRHNAEMVGFHLSRLMNYRRVPLVAGRTIDLARDIIPVATDQLLKTFFRKDSNLCFYGKCMYCKSEADGVCAKGTKMEGAVVIFLPPQFEYKKHRHPWQRTYRDDKKARWEVDDAYCSLVKKVPLYREGPLLNDIMDACVFDYMMGNADRHHYETFKDEPDSMLMMWDSGKSFGNPYHDERTILAPLYQCCRIRRSTWERLQLLQEGILSDVLKSIMKQDPLSPLLTEAHFKAMDRRLIDILNIIDKCILNHGEDYVIVKDRYS